MVKNPKVFTREDTIRLYQGPPFNYSGWELENAMRKFDQRIEDQKEWNKNHADILPKDMKQITFNGFSSYSIDDVIEIECKCGQILTINGGSITLCLNCGRGYRVISYIAQYELSNFMLEE
jgi:hypothetical protein